MSASLITPATYLRFATKSLRLLSGELLSSSVMPLRQYSRPSSSNTKFTYRLAAAASPKRAPPRPPKLGQDSWHYTSTDPSAKPRYLRSSKRDSGEDAFFATTVGGSANHVAFGLADGVGGWQDQGIDPSDFSHGLCGLMAGTAYMHGKAEEGDKADLSQLPRPRDLMQVAYDAVIGNPRIVAGGCTASLGVAGAHGKLETANLGDSGFLILSPGKVAARSAVQTHAFNTPYQLSKVPAKMQAQHAIFGGSTHFSETPKQADVESHQLKHGDLVVFATDGVWDNLSAQDTLDIVSKVMEEQGAWFKSHNFAGAETMLNASLIATLPRSLEGGEKEAEKYLPGLVATAVMREAKVAGLDRRRDGPFAKEVKKQYPQEGWQGGKPDDIAVVVAVAVEEEDKPVRAKL